MTRTLRTTCALLVTALACSAGGATPATAREASLQLELLPVQSFSAVLTPAQPVATVPITVDANALVVVSSTSRELQPALVSPTGERFAFGEPLRRGVASEAIPDPAQPGITGVNYYFTLEGAESGNWAIEVSQQGGVQANVELSCDVIYESARAASLLGTGETYPVGANVNLGFVLTNGTSLATGLNPTGRLFKIDDPTFPDTEVAFADADGDAVYTLTFVPAQPGEYQVNARATATDAGVPYARTAGGRFLVVSQAGTLDGSFHDRSIDDDADTRIDRIGVAPGASVIEPGTFLVTLILTGGNGRQLQATVAQDLSAGTSFPEVHFDAREVGRVLGDGPYAVSVARLERKRSDGAVVQDEKYDLGLTAAYRAADFARDPIILVGNPDAFGTDVNANQRFDLLSVQLHLDLLTSAGYSWSARLVDPHGTELGFTTGSASLTAGSQTIALNFPGEPIGANGVDGPYDIRSFIIFGGGESLIANSAGFTPFFSASQFEGFVNPDVTPPVLAVTLSPTELWPPNHGLVEITPTVVVVDDFDPHPAVALEAIQSSEGDDMTGDGHTTNDIQVDPQGRIFLRAERAGGATGRVYTLTYRASDATGNATTVDARVMVPHDRKGGGGRSTTRKQTGDEGMLAVAATSASFVHTGDLVSVRWATAHTVGRVSANARLRDQKSGAETPVAAEAEGQDWETWAMQELPGGVYDVLVSIHDDRPGPPTEVVAGALRLQGGKEGTGVPGATLLHGPFPNPFNPQTTLELALAADADVTLVVYDVAGRVVRHLTSGRLPAGTHTVVWDGSDDTGTPVSSGTYITRLTLDGKAVRGAERRLVLVR
jgi:hypothetical protein